MTEGAPQEPEPEPDRARLAALTAEAWEAWIESEPTFATAIGDRRFDDRLPPVRPDDRAASEDRLEAVLVRARALLARPWPTSADRVTASALVSFVEGALDLRRSRVDAWTVDPLNGPQVTFLDLPSYQPVRTPDEARTLIARWRAMGPWIDDHAAGVRSALADGRVSPEAPIRRVLDELDGTLARPDADWPLLDPARSLPHDWPAAEREAFAGELAAVVAEVVRPAFARYRSVLSDEIVPRARSDDRPGLVHVPGGPEAYERLVRAHTSLDLDAVTIHRIGLDAVTAVDEELDELARRVLGTSGRAAAVARLRADPTLHFATGEQVFDVAQTSLRRAADAIGSWFGTLPAAPCEVIEMGPHEAEHSTIAYYREPAADGSRPGRYYVNTSHPGTRPRYEAEALAFHESIPGHHLQLTIAQERADLPTFRRFGGATAFVEGWGLYAERLADEMGLYSGDLDRIGVLSYDGWRACRLVVDTGLHALGWSRDEAIAFMVDHTALAENNIANEVDRYISMPGQALAYKLGQLELLRLRDTARETLGPRFDIRRFHDVVLGEGALPLGTLGEVVRAWIAATPA
jgi:uncharacterized protein (DUF885 family)